VLIFLGNPDRNFFFVTDKHNRETVRYAKVKEREILRSNLLFAGCLASVSIKSEVKRAQLPACISCAVVHVSVNYERVTDVIR